MGVAEARAGLPHGAKRQRSAIPTTLASIIGPHHRLEHGHAPLPSIAHALMPVPPPHPMGGTLLAARQASAEVDFSMGEPFHLGGR